MSDPLDFDGVPLDARFMAAAVGVCVVAFAFVVGICALIEAMK